MKTEYKSYEEFWGYHFRIVERHKIEGIFEWDKKLVNFIEHVCDIRPGMNVLDLACGGGDQAKVFAHKGYNVTGIDKVPSLIEFANMQFKNENIRGKFVIGDMRDIKYENEFDLVIILSGSFGFFSDKDNYKLLESIYRSLKDGGGIFISFLTTSSFPSRSKYWSEDEEAYYLGEVWIDEEKSTYNSTKTIIRKDGVIIKPAIENEYNADEVIRCYSFVEIKNMLSEVGFNSIESYNDRSLDIPIRELKTETPRNLVKACK